MARRSLLVSERDRCLSDCCGPEEEAYPPRNGIGCGRMATRGTNYRTGIQVALGDSGPSDDTTFVQRLTLINDAPKEE